MAKRKINWDKCEASGAKLVGRDWYTVSYKDGKTICNCCGKAVKIVTRGEYEYIPVHNILKEVE